MRRVTEQHDKRAPRVKVVLHLADGSGEPIGKTRNLSVSGVFVETSLRPQVGENVTLTMVWGTDTFVVEAEVIRHASDGLGLRYINPDAYFLYALGEIIGTHPEE